MAETEGGDNKAALSTTDVKLLQSITNVGVVDVIGKKTQADAFSLLAQNAGIYMSRAIGSSSGLIERLAAKMAADPNYPIETEILAEYMSQMNIADMLMSAGIWGGLGSSLAQLAEGMMGTNKLAYWYKNLRWDVALTGVMTRYWASKYPYNVPKSQLGWELWKDGEITDAQYKGLLQFEGYSTYWQSKIFSAQQRKPDMYLAFTMHKRNQISRATLNEYLKADGWAPNMHDGLVSAMHRTPSLRNLSQMADYVPMPATWIYENLKKDGYTDADALVMSQYLTDKPLREEKRNVSGRLLWDYQQGRLSRDACEAGLNDMGVMQAERDLLLEWGDLRYADELIDEALVLIKYKCSAGHPDFQTVSDLSDACEALGINVEKSNLIAETYYYQYVYVPP